jgi:cytoskeletal protein CcmA (bactofilin family)
MPSPKQNKISVTCPKCGHVQPEPRGAYSTVCKKCQAHFRLEELTEAAPKKKKQAPEKPAFEQKPVICFQCGTELLVSAAAESTMCKRCSSHVDLRDYQISQTVSKNFRTHGRFVLEEKGYIMNTDSLVGDAVIKGRFIGKINAVRTLEIHSTATIKGTISTGKLIIPAGHHFRWPELRIGGADIAGELVARVYSSGTVFLRSTSRVFGDIDAANLVMENGAVFVGAARIGCKAEAAPKVLEVVPEKAAPKTPSPRPSPARKATSSARSKSSSSSFSSSSSIS